MASKNVEWVLFQGKGSWAKNLFQPDFEYKNWNVKLHFNDESYNKFMQLKEKEGAYEGILNEVKEDEDGYYHTFKRPTHKDFGNGEEPLTPPEIFKLGPNGEELPWDRNIDIGNGSDITIKCELYKYTNRRTKKNGRAIRLASVRVDNLVPYTKKDYTPRQEQAVAGYETTPPQPLF